MTPSQNSPSMNEEPSSPSTPSSTTAALNAFKEGAGQNSHDMNESEKKVTGETSDGYHTFNELYDHRCTLYLAVMKAHPSLAWISTKHADDSTFDGWFIAGMKLPTGDVSYHLPARMWSLACETGATILERGHEWDGHTSADVVKRMQAWIAQQPAPTQSAVNQAAEETPRTDAEFERIDNLDNVEPFPAMATFARTLEKELNEMTDHKDDWMGKHYALSSQLAKLSAERECGKCITLSNDFPWAEEVHCAFHSLEKKVEELTAQLEHEHNFDAATDTLAKDAAPWEPHTIPTPEEAFAYFKKQAMEPSESAIRLSKFIPLDYQCVMVDRAVAVQMVGFISNLETALVTATRQNEEMAKERDEAEASKRWALAERDRAEREKDFSLEYHAKIRAEYDEWRGKIDAERNRALESRDNALAMVETMRGAAIVSGSLVRAGTFIAGDEEVTGLIVQCTQADLAAMKTLPMYKRVTLALSQVPPTEKGEGRP